MQNLRTTWDGSTMMSVPPGYMPMHHVGMPYGPPKYPIYGALSQPFMQTVHPPVYSVVHQNHNQQNRAPGPWPLEKPSNTKLGDMN